MQLWNLNAALNNVAENAEDAAESLLNKASASSGDLSSLMDNFDPMNFVENLSYMGVGMLGIFIVMGTLIIGTAILNKVTSRKSKK